MTIDLCHYSAHCPKICKLYYIIVYPCLFAKKLYLNSVDFFRCRSVETNLSSFLNDVVSIVYNSEQTDVYFEMTKAFDKVDHRLLLAKLNMYGLCPRLCNLFNSYLSRRANLVHVPGSTLS